MLYIYLIMISEMAVGDGDAGWSHDSINDTIWAIWHGNMINPNIGCTEDGNPIAIAHCSKTDMIHRIPNHATTARDNVMNVEAVDDDILDELDSNARAIGN